MINKSGRHNDNSYVPNSAQNTNDQLLKRCETLKIARLIIDGSNVCYWSGRPTLKPVLTLMNALLRKNIPFDCIFDASTRHKLGGERAIYDYLEKNHRKYFNQAPAGAQADTYILMAADAAPDTAIISQDRYQAFLPEYPWLQSRTRLYSGMVVGERLLVHALAINLPVPNTLPALQQEFEGLIPLAHTDTNNQFNSIRRAE